MRQRWFAVLAGASLGACGMEATEPELSEIEQPVTLVFYEKFDSFANGSVNGQHGWTGNCNVVGSGDKFLACGPSTGAEAPTGRETAGSYYMQYDVTMSNVVNFTHGKLFIEGDTSGNDGTVFQVISGCGGIRAAFGYYASTTRNLISFNHCGAASAPWYRVACIWTRPGDAVYCGAAQHPEDPTQFVRIPALDDAGHPEEMPDFTKVRLVGGINGLPGTTYFDKIYIEKE